MFGREFQVVGAVQQKACLEKLVLCNGTDSSGTVEERSVRARCDETAEVGRCLRAVDLETVNSYYHTIPYSFNEKVDKPQLYSSCLLYTSDAADE